MRAEGMRAVSGYLEAFLLIGLAIGGSGIVLGAATRYGAALQGPSVSVADATVVQGVYFAVEKFTLYDTGQTQITSFVVVTPGMPSSASYCYSLSNPATKAAITSTCPTMASNPQTVPLTYSLATGSAVTVAIEVAGTPFAVGSSVSLTVITSPAATYVAEVQVLPA